MNDFIDTIMTNNFVLLGTKGTISDISAVRSQLQLLGLPISVTVNNQ